MIKYVQRSLWLVTLLAISLPSCKRVSRSLLRHEPSDIDCTDELASYVREKQLPEIMSKD